jgi:replicative DNA helicase
MNLPAHPDLERYVLGHALVEPDRLDALRTEIAPELFSLDQHRDIWRFICELYDAGLPVDRVTVEKAARAARRNIGGMGYLADLDTGIPEKASIAGYVERLREAELRRRMMEVAHHLELIAADELHPVDEVLDGFTSAVSDMAGATSGAKRPISTSDLVASEGILNILAPRKQTGIRLPWKELSRSVAGLSAGQMVVLMAATSRGKTSMALQIAVHAAEQQKPPVIWTMEMSPRSLFQRIMTQLMGSQSTAQNPTFQERENQRLAFARVEDSPLYFDQSSRSVASFTASLRQVRSRGGLGIAIVDYLQLIRGSGRRANRAQEVSDNSRSLKLAAMDLGIPFVVLSQVDRGSVKGDGKIGLHSGKESGDIENDADIVLWIEAGELSRDAPTAVSLHVGKQREGPAGFSIPMMFLPTSQTFQEVSE